MRDAISNKKKKRADMPAHRKAHKTMCCLLLVARGAEIRYVRVRKQEEEAKKQQKEEEEHVNGVANGRKRKDKASPKIGETRHGSVREKPIFPL